jgi:enoyl-CoA hydratase
MEDTNFENLIYEVRDGKAYVTLNRPEKLNALSRELQQDIHDAMWAADNDKRVHCVVLSGNGRAFCAGYDLTAPKIDPGEFGRSSGSSESIDDDTWGMELQQRLRMAIFDMHKPVIGKVHGYCIAGGTDLVLLADIIIAADDAIIGFPPVRAMGVPPAHMWLYHVGPQWAKRMLLTGDSISGADAAEIGLVLQAVPYDQLDEAVEYLADRMAMIDSDLLSASKRTVNLGLELMGARTMQRLSSEMDARAHLATAVSDYGEIAKGQGLKAALEWRDTKFGDGRATPAYQNRRATQEERNTDV